MTIFCLGTSNFIISTSCLRDFKDLVDEEVRNLSVGASPSAAAMYFLDGEEIKAGDVFLIDYAINDNAYVLSGVSSAERLRSNLASCVGYLLERGGVPIVIINPEAHSMKAATVSGQVHIDFCKDAGIPFVDLSDAFRQAVARGADQSLLMVDPAHQSPRVAPLIAHTLAVAIRTARACHLDFRISEVPTFSFRRLDIGRMVINERRVSRSSSLRSSIMASLSQGDSLHLPIGLGEQLQGLMINSGAPGGVIEISGCKSSTVLMLRPEWNNDDPNAYMMAFIELQKPVEGGDEGIQIRVLPEGSIPTEPILLDRASFPELYGTVHIEGGLVVNVTGPKASGATLAPPEQDLLRDRREVLVAELLVLGRLEEALPL